MFVGDSGYGDEMTTPRKVQKRLFPTGSGSSKRNLFREKRTVSPGRETSGDESDLGPMSPLALSDRSPSSTGSSPGRRFDSPLTTPQGTPRSLSYASWDRLTPGRSSGCWNDVESPFSALKKLTRVSRSSPRRKIYPGSPGSSKSTPEKRLSREIPPTTPQRVGERPDWDEIIPETPTRNFGRDILNDTRLDCEIVAETPQKDSPMRRLITPLGSVSKEAALPRLHHRKSLNAFESDESASPVDRKENELKRHAHDALASAATKLFKSDDNPSIPKARAALFQEEKKEFKLSTKSFYSSSLTEQKRERSISVEHRDVERAKKKRSLPLHTANIRRLAKKRRYGEINSGVGHGIKKPKPKRHVSRSEAFKKQKQNLSPPLFTPNSQSSLATEDIQRNAPQDAVVIRLTSPHIESASPVEKICPPSPQPDPNKRFFKTNRTMEVNRLATVTVNNKIKLQVSNGKIALESQKTPRNGKKHKRPRLADLKFDANDLTVDEPAFDVQMDQGSVANILKVLEDDWAEDEYDTMATLTNNNPESVISPLKSMSIPKDVMMSPASELSNMTSIMNIGEAAGPTNFINILNNNNNATSNEGDGEIEKDKESKKYFPLFNKGHTDTSMFEETTKKGTRGTKRGLSWQMGAKAGGNEDQYQLDVGQKRFGATQCPECRIVYQMGDPADENSHLNYHNSLNTLKFPGWKKERVIVQDPFTASRIILIEPGDAKHCWRKVAEILAIVDKDLGLADTKLSEFRDKKVYMYIREKRVLGVLVAEYVKTAHRMIPELIELDCCSSETTPVKCGVNVVWTAMSHRKQGIATKLLDTLRANFYFGYVMSLDDIAFSIPGPVGKAFAEKYSKTRNFKVYS